MKLTAVQNVKFLRLKRRLKLAHWQAVGLLESLWLFTQANAPAGDVGRHSNEDIAASIEWDGDADSLIASLAECGWIDDDDDHRLLIHDWADHVPTYLKGAMAKHGKDFAKQSAKQSATQPAKHGPKQPAKHDAKQTQSDIKHDAPCRTLPNLALPSVGEGELDSCSEPSSTTTREPKAAEPIAENFPPVECSGPVKQWRMTATKLFEWRETFATLDVDAEIRKAIQWLRDNPGKRKTAKGMPAYIGRWLSKATNDTGRGGVLPFGNGTNRETADERRARKMLELERDFN